MPSAEQLPPRRADCRQVQPWQQVGVPRAHYSTLSTKKPGCYAYCALHVCIESRKSKSESRLSTISSRVAPVRNLEEMAKEIGKGKESTIKTRDFSTEAKMTRETEQKQNQVMHMMPLTRITFPGILLSGRRSSPLTSTMWRTDTGQRTATLMPDRPCHALHLSV